MAALSGVGEDEAQAIFAEAFNPAATSEGEEGNTDNTTPEAKESWPVIDEAAYHGLAGNFVKALDPHTEADPVGILIQFLVASSETLSATYLTIKSKATDIISPHSTVAGSFSGP
jgi:hypothetical protein